jgi:hypothetical protein
MFPPLSHTTTLVASQFDEQPCRTAARRAGRGPSPPQAPRPPARPLTAGPTDRRPPPTVSPGRT